MKKIIVIGTTGSGKSTLAKALSERLGLPRIELDSLFWEPNWQGSSDEEFFKKIESALAGKAGWIIDGNYTRANHLMWPQADTVIWIDLPFYLTFYQSFKRTLVRAIKKEELWPGTGNRESVSRMFSRDSILVWLFKTYRQNVVKNTARMVDPTLAHLRFYRLRSRNEVLSFTYHLKTPTPSKLR